MTRPNATTEATAPDRRKRASVWQVLIGAGMLAMAFGVFLLVPRQLGHEASASTPQANVEKGASERFHPTPSPMGIADGRARRDGNVP